MTLKTETLTTPKPATHPEMPREADAKDLEQTRPLKLSEALRLGAMNTKQVFQDLGSTKDGTTCGIGAVFVGLGYEFDGASHHDVMAKHPELQVLDTPVNFGGRLPKGCGHAAKGTVVDQIIHLNDKHRLPRNQIADWLQSLGL